MALRGRSIVIRADAGLDIGTGHVMRCIALAQELAAHGRTCTFVSASLPAPLIERLGQEGFNHLPLASEPGSSEDACEVVGIARQLNASWLVLDGYHFDADYQRRVKESGLRLLVIDDYRHATDYCADILLNQNLHARRELYPVECSVRFLLGTNFTLLRREFRNGPVKRTFPDVASCLLVTLGGSDPKNVTGTILRGLELLPDVLEEIVVVVGGSNPHVDALAASVRDSGRNVRIERNVRDMAEVMRDADIAITASGGTAWELAARGVPAIVLSIADNQSPVAASLHELGAAVSLGPASELTPASVAAAASALIFDRARRIELSSNARRLIDGEGASRVVETMLELETGMNQSGITMRRAVADDARLLWEWANDPGTRAVSFSSDPIPWEDHLRWLERKLSDPACRLYIGLNRDGEPIGQVRFDIDGLVAMLSVSLDARFRGMGYGAPLLRQASRALFTETTVDDIEAFVKPANQASLRVFSKAGFAEYGEKLVNGQPATCFHLKRSMIL